MAWRSSSFFLATLLFVGFVIALMLADQSFLAARSHRLAAEAVLRDYAELAGETLVSRVYEDVGYRGIYPVGQALQTWFETNDALPDRSALTSILTPPNRAAAELVDFSFAWSTHPDEAVDELPWIEPPDTPGADAARAFVHAQATTPIDEPVARPPFAVWHDTQVSPRRTYIAMAIERPESVRRGYLGFALDRTTVGHWIGRAVARGPLLPASLLDSPDAATLDAGALHLTVRDPEGVVLYAGPPDATFDRSRTSPYDPELAGVVHFGDDYQGLLTGATIHVELDPAAAPALVIGGLPSSRLPLLVALLTLTAGVSVAAFLLLRRERALARMRTDFVSRVSHELRTPLTQIRMFTETLLLERTRTPAEARRALVIVDREARRLGHLVDNVLRFARHERKGAPLAMATHEWGSLMRGIVAQCRALFADAQLVIEDPRTDGEDAQVAVDEEAWAQVVRNLLDNAVKYGPDDGTVWIGWDTDATHVRLWVEDQGPGVPRGQRARIWRRFARLDRPLESTVAGTGIGLSVVRELVERHGGTVTIEDGRAGGARFVVTLPVRSTS